MLTQSNPAQQAGCSEAGPTQRSPRAPQRGAGSGKAEANVIVERRLVTATRMKDVKSFMILSVRIICE